MYIKKKKIYVYLKSQIDICKTRALKIDTL